MNMPSEVFTNPNKYWAFLTASKDEDFEGQFFDRKEAGQVSVDQTTLRNQLQKVRDQITESVSAFANSNIEGGLLVLGIAKDGSVPGIEHLNENQQNSLLRINDLLRGQQSQCRLHTSKDSSGTEKTVALFFVPFSERYICETNESHPKAWQRQGAQNILLNQDTRNQVLREKRIVCFENTYCCKFNPEDLDRGIITEFKTVYLPDSSHSQSDEEMLYQIGALDKDKDGYYFTNAGFLFFSANPQRCLPYAYIRLLKFADNFSFDSTRGLPIYDKKFTGPITKQIKDTRNFFKEAAFFKVYQMRKKDGGFKEEPEYPIIAIDETIVNAIAHRDYGIEIPIECEAYYDAFILKNAGRMRQRDTTLPDVFTLADKVLHSSPRNSKLLEWMRLLRDSDGRSFVQALSEGTRRMRDEMMLAGLPSPEYQLAQTQTKVLLRNNVEERERKNNVFSGDLTNVAISTEYVNLFPLKLDRSGLTGSALSVIIRFNEIMIPLIDKLVSKNWYLDKSSFSRVVVHQRGSEICLPDNVAGYLRMFPAYEFQLHEVQEQLFASIDYAVQVNNVVFLNRLIQDIPSHVLNGLRAKVKIDNVWEDARIEKCDVEWTDVSLLASQTTQRVMSSSVLPQIGIHLLEEIVKKHVPSFDLPSQIKRASLASETGAARKRSEKMKLIAQYLKSEIFPLTIGNIAISLSDLPIRLSDRPTESGTSLQLYRLAEPTVEFRAHNSTTDVRDGITRFGSYENDAHEIELVPVCLNSQREKIQELINRLKTGKQKYRGSERTFASRFVYSSVITAESPNQIPNEIQRTLIENPTWSGNNKLNRLFLVETPLLGYSLDDEKSPYYLIKRMLFEKGIPCQMINTTTITDPNFKDLNLSLNIVAKCGITPWVLPDAIPDADFFIGLSYTQSRNGQRLLGFANVFNSFGRWEFYSGNIMTCEFEKRSEGFAQLISQTLSRLALSEAPNVVLHYSAKFSKDDRLAILKAAKVIRPDGTFSFIWINDNHSVRLYDESPETDGSLRRGAFFSAGESRIYMSTTGYNPFRRALGTPRPLQINAWVYRPDRVSSSPPDMRTIAVQTLSLTKLNWASTDSFCGQPITIKYAGDIAYLTAAFQRQQKDFRLHPVLESTPWFI